MTVREAEELVYQKEKEQTRLYDEYRSVIENAQKDVSEAFAQYNRKTEKSKKRKQMRIFLSSLIIAIVIFVTVLIFVSDTTFKISGLACGCLVFFYGYRASKKSKEAADERGKVISEYNSTLQKFEDSCAYSCNYVSGGRK